MSNSKGLRRLGKRRTNESRVPTDRERVIISLFGPLGNPLASSSQAGPTAPHPAANDSRQQHSDGEHVGQVRIFRFFSHAYFIAAFTRCRAFGRLG